MDTKEFSKKELKANIYDMFDPGIDSSSHEEDDTDLELIGVTPYGYDNYYDYIQHKKAGRLLKISKDQVLRKINKI